MKEQIDLVTFSFAKNCYFFFEGFLVVLKIHLIHKKQINSFMPSYLNSLPPKNK